MTFILQQVLGQSGGFSLMENIVAPVVLVIIISGVPAIFLYFWRLSQRLADGDRRMSALEKAMTDLDDEVQEVKLEINKKMDRIEDKIDQFMSATDSIRAENAKQSADVHGAMARVDDGIKHIGFIANQVQEFFGDAKPGRGITAKVKKALREEMVMQGVIQQRPADTIYPDDDLGPADAGDALAGYPPALVGSKPVPPRVTPVPPHTASKKPHSAPRLTPHAGDYPAYDISIEDASDRRALLRREARLQTALDAARDERERQRIHAELDTLRGQLDALDTAGD